ncbi:MAG: universal stress protein, partial [Deltaproteobacteria bacterium]|nr:universal stress protein [Deltaproteobacteria bacterium]
MGTAATTSSLLAPSPHAHRILVCVDRSPLGDRCVPFAVSLARALHSSLVLVHVMAPRRDHAGLHTDALGWEISRQEARADLERLQHEAELALDAPVEIRLEQGHPAERIIALARELHADLTVIGSHGQGGVTAWHLGSTAHQVVTVAGGSVFVARACATAVLPPRRILVPLDGSQRTESVLPTAARLAETCGAELVLLHVIQEPIPTAVLRDAVDLDLARRLAAHLELSATAYLERLRAGLVRDGAVIQTRIVRHASQGQAILAVARHDHADLIVVTAHGAACDPSRPFGTVTEELLTHAEVPLLVLQDLPEHEHQLRALAPAPAPPPRASHPP